jgi:small nuclear ribonucleoprotein G
VKLNGNRNVTGTLRGFDQFLNIVLENCVEDRGAQGKVSIPDMVVRHARNLLSLVALRCCLRAANCNERDFLRCLRIFLFFLDLFVARLLSRHLFTISIRQSNAK